MWLVILGCTVLLLSVLYMYLHMCILCYFDIICTTAHQQMQRSFYETDFGMNDKFQRGFLPTLSVSRAAWVVSKLIGYLLCQYLLSWTSTVAVALLDVGFVALVPHQFLQSIGEGQVQLHVMLLLLLLLHKAFSRGSPPRHSPPLQTTHKSMLFFPHHALALCIFQQMHTNIISHVQIAL